MSQTQLTILQHMRQSLTNAVTYSLTHEYDHYRFITHPHPLPFKATVSQTTASAHDDHPRTTKRHKMPIPTTLLFTTIKSGRLCPPPPFEGGGGNHYTSYKGTPPARLRCKPPCARKRQDKASDATSQGRNKNEARCSLLIFVNGCRCT